MKPDTVKLLWDLFGVPALVIVLTLIAIGAFSAWVDYQVQKDGNRWSR